MSKSIAIVGVNGYLAKPIINALLEPTFRDNFKLPIRAISRKIANSSTSEIEYHEASDVASYEKAFQGVDVVIDLRNAMVVTNDVATAAANAGVKLLVPSEFGIDYDNAEKYSKAFFFKTDFSNFAKGLGLQVVEFKTGYFIDSTLDPWGEEIIYFNYKDKVSDYADDGSSEITFNSLKNIGQSVASVISRPYNEIPAKVRVSADSISPAKFVELYEKYTGNKVTLKRKTTEDVVREGDEALSNPGPDNFFKILRVASLVTKAVNFTSDNDNEFVNPGEKYFKWETVEEYIPKLLA